MEEKKNGVKVVIIVMVLVILALGGYIVYDKFFSDTPAAENMENDVDSTDENNQTDETNTPSIEELNVTDTFVVDLIARYTSYVRNTTTEISDALYSREVTTPNDLSQDYILMTSVRDLVSSQSFTYRELLERVQTLYGSNMTVSAESFGDQCEMYNYDSTTQTYTQTIGGCGGTSAASMESKIMKATQEGDTVLIDVAVANLNYASQAVTDPTTDQAFAGLTADSFDIDTNADQVAQYQYKFSYDDTRHNYYLVSITKIK